MVIDFKKEWPKLKRQLKQYGQEAVVLAKRGEEEAKKFSYEGKLRFDAAALGLRREKLYYLIGKEFVKSPAAQRAKSAPKLLKLVEEFKQLSREEKALNRKIKDSKS